MSPSGGGGSQIMQTVKMHHRIIDEISVASLNCCCQNVGPFCLFPKKGFNLVRTNDDIKVSLFEGREEILHSRYCQFNTFKETIIFYF